MGWSLTQRKCEKIIINFFQHRIPCAQPLFVNRKSVERVRSYKLLDVYLSEDVTCKIHVEYILKQENSLHFSLRRVKKVGLHHTDHITLHCLIVRSTLEYESPVWASLLDFLYSYLEPVQKRALKIIFAGVPYFKTLECPTSNPVPFCIETAREKALVKSGHVIPQILDIFVTWSCDCYAITGDESY